MNEQFCKVGDIELCYETFGDSSDPALLLIMGLGTQMLGWNEDFCAELAGRGFFVIRYDNRDVGRSTHLDSVPPPTVMELVRRKPKNVAYKLGDMAEDAAGLLDCLGIERAHLVGASMGGMIAQVLAARHAERVLSLTSIMSTTGSRWKGQPSLRVIPAFLERPAEGKEAYVERIAKLFRLIGSPGFERDEAEIRALAEQAFDRGAEPAGPARQMAAIIASGHRAEELRQVEAPTLVIHGTKDRLIRKSGGKATAKAIPGARLKLIEGMGHDLPRGTWPEIMDGIASNAKRAGEPVEQAA